MTLKSLYARIPHVKGCLPDCGGCCFKAPISLPELARIPAHLMLVPPKPESEMCRYLSDDCKCKIYDYRPLTCRIFAASDGFVCPFGAHADKPLTEAETQALYDDYGPFLDKGEFEI